MAWQGQMSWFDVLTKHRLAAGRRRSAMDYFSAQPQNYFFFASM
jgi:hypothetical protein